jgi:succinate dehydrogenase / fumarate reductase, cytochrome b subunit
MSADAQNNRPLSPHLQIYKPIPTMVASITHRITGAALYFGTLLVAWWLIATASGPVYFDFVQSIFGSWFGRLVLFFYTWALVQHMLGGLKHLMWDTGKGMEKEQSTRLAKLIFVLAPILTLLIWFSGYAIRLGGNI